MLHLIRDKNFLIQDLKNYFLDYICIRMRTESDIRYLIN